MRSITRALVFITLIVPIAAFAQSEPPSVSATVPRLIQVTGVFQPADGQAASAIEVVTVSIYADPDGGLPVWQERQSVAVEKTTGRFTLLLGASHPDGIPAEVFGAGQAQWMSLLFERAGEREQARVRIASVPYALKASDAETLGGLPASAYLRASTADGADVVNPDTSPAVTTTDAPPTADLVLPGTTNFLAKYVNGADVGNSAVYEAGGLVGIGTTTPGEILHVRFNDPSGARTGLAVQNMGNTNTSYSGMLFYDQFGALVQFQGFNNITHEYRINNIATGASINFMLGSVSRLFVAPGGNIGIGTTVPSARLHVVDNSLIGVRGQTNSSINAGVYGYNTGGGRGVWGYSTSGVGTEGQSDSASYSGVYGSNSGGGKGVWGFSSSGIGTQGQSDSGNGIAGISGTGSGVSGQTNSSINAGVYGYNTGGGRGVWGYSPTGVGTQGQSGSGHGIYGYSSSGYAGYFEGNVYVTGSVTQNSDIRLKQSVSNLGYGLPEVLRLRPVTWHWIDRPDRGLQLGLIAQEIETVLPELVTTSKDAEQTKGLNYVGLVPVMIKAIQEQQTTIDTLQRRNAELDTKNDLLRERVAEIERQISEALAKVSQR